MGDDEYAELVVARWPVLVRTAVALGCSLHEAEDLVQTTLVQAYVKWSKVAAADNRDAYVATMLLNAFRTSRRRGRAQREVPVSVVPEQTDGDGAEQRAAADALRRAVAVLPRGQREVVALSFYARLTEPEIADALGIARGTVKSRLSRALTSLATDDSIDELRTRRP